MRPLGVLDETEEARLAEHLDECSSCRAVEEAAKEVLRAEASLPEVTTPDSFGRIEAKLDEVERAGGSELVVSIACTYCHGSLFRPEAVYCASCLAPAHEDCFARHGRCSAPGCGQEAFVRATRPLAAAAPRERPRPRQLAMPLVAIGLGAVGAALVASSRPASPTHAQPKPPPTVSAPVGPEAPLDDSFLKDAKELLAQLERADETPRRLEYLPIPGSVPSTPASLRPIANDLACAVKGFDATTAFAIKGRAADLRDGTIVDVFLFYEGAIVTSTSTTVAKGEISAVFGPWPDKRVVPGRYSAVVRADPASGRRLGRNTVAFELKDEVLSAKLRDEVKRKMLETAEAYRLPYLTLASSGSYYLPALTVPMSYAKDPKQTPEVRARAKREFEQSVKDTAPNWTRLDEEAWEGEFKTARADWQAYRRQFLGFPNPEAEALLDKLLWAITTWHDRMNVGLHILCGLPRPAKEGDREPSDLWSAQAAVAERARAFYAKLGIEKSPSFTLSNLAQRERGDSTTTWFKSRLTHFAVGRPDQWWFAPNGHRPEIRLREFPGDVATTGSGMTSEVVAYVEILDYPGAQSDAELAKLHEDRESVRWGDPVGTLSVQRLEVTDPTMPSGERRGLVHEATFDDPKSGKRHFRDRVLFARDHKRTYGVVCIAPEAQWPSLEKTFDQIARTLRVLDGPEFDDSVLSVKREAIEAEGRDADRALKLAPDWENGVGLR
jgi:hypothetical protein